METTNATTTTTETAIKPALPPQRLENTNAFLRERYPNGAPAGTEILFVLVTTARGGVEYRPALKFAERGVDLSDYAARFFTRRDTEKPVYDELNATGNTFDFAAGTVSHPLTFAERTGAFPGFIKTRGGLQPRPVIISPPVVETTPVDPIAVETTPVDPPVVETTPVKQKRVRRKPVKSTPVESSRIELTVIEPSDIGTILL